MRKKPGILFFYQHFWPDSTPYANMLRAMGKQLIDKGHDVSMLTAQPSYRSVDFERLCQKREIIDGIQVTRLPNLPGAKSIRPIALVGKVLFPVRALFSVIGKKITGSAPDVVIAATIPPVINGAFGLISARIAGARFIYHLQDIYPEVGAAGGLWSSESLRFKILAWIDSSICRRADACVVLSQDMHRSLTKRGVDSESIKIINNFTLESFSLETGDAALASPVAPEKIQNTGNAPLYRLVFAGNLGRFQALESLLESFLDERVRKLPLELHFLGDGAAKNDLMAQAGGDERVIFHNHVPVEQASSFVAQCDVGLVSIAPNVIRYAYPSKTFFYLSLDVPLFALVETDSQLASEIQEHGLGVVCGGSSQNELVESFCNLVDWLDHRTIESGRMRGYMMQQGSCEVAVRQWDLLIDNLV